MASMVGRPPVVSRVMVQSSGAPPAPAPLASFVVVSTQRSGSNWVEDRIDSHPDLTMVRSEPFRTTSDRADSYQAYRRRRHLYTVLAPPLAKAAFVDEILG